MNDWCVQGWRQQSTDREQILAWLSEAKQLGFERYNLFKQGECYWLCCATTEQLDMAAAIRSQVREQAAVVVQQWCQQLIVVAWQQQTLLACCQFSADKHGVQNFLYVAENWLKPEQMNCVLVIAGQTTRRLFDHVEPIQNAKQIPEFNFEKSLKLAKMRSLRQLPPWLRRRILVRGVAAALLVTGASVWWFWPTSPAPVVMVPVTEFPEPAPLLQGWQQQHVLHVDKLLSQVSFLAGWKATQWQLDEAGETLWMQQSYGSHSDLLMQLPSQDWQLEGNGQGVQLQRKPPADVLYSADIPMPKGDLNTQKLSSDQALIEAGFSQTQTPNHIEVQHLLFDPFTSHQWQVFLHWLAVRPDMRIQKVVATPEHLSWRITITLQHP
ncbi:hypothetical protein [Pseudidiomarina woesei]|uniref:Uncharacterized protein n=1 Tax=Pseudidiomarina woesei TaxID=1381080 RepID=A0A0K6GYJ5_9GAMM|nr:hypothetical protein [Pseudidiomarina woesei]CUA83563.1 hypothetical protein Ga0061064_0672 [Pseudidiomarina woesei]